MPFFSLEERWRSQEKLSAVHNPEQWGKQGTGRGRIRDTIKSVKRAQRSTRRLKLWKLKKIAVPSGGGYTIGISDVIVLKFM